MMLCCGVVVLWCVCGVVVLWCCGVCVCVACCCGISQILRELEAGVGGPVANPRNLSKYRAERPPFFVGVCFFLVHRKFRRRSGSARTSRVSKISSLAWFYKQK